MPPPSGPALPASSPTPPTPRHRVLIADDAEETTLLLSRLLTKAGYECFTAADGADCLQKFDRLGPELVIVDIMMPGVHGMDVLRQIKAGPRGGKTGIIMISARAFEPDKERATALGAFGYLVKPIQRVQLLALVAAFFAGEVRPAPGSIEPTALPAADEIYMPELDSSRGVFRLYGTRGSIPVPGAAVARYGGNTSCLEVRHGTDVVIIDAGTGIRECGIDLARQGPRPLHLFVGHTHWDHIQGFPFFAPAYIPGFELSVYGASGFRKDLKSIFQGQLDYDYFPVDMRDMRAAMTFATLDASPVRIGNINVHWEWAIHPGATVCFKIEIGGIKIGYVTDNEFLRGYLGHPAKALAATDMLSPYRAIIDFFTGVDVLIAEAQYTNEEYLKKIGWGHTSISNACVLAALTGVRKWIVTHHDPIHDDAAVDRKIALIRQVLREIGHEAEVSAGYDGMTLYL